MTFQEMAEQLGNADRIEIKRKTATWLEWNDGTIVLRYHDTDVITWFPNDKMVLDSGSWRTATTKRRLNEYLPEGLTVTQDRGVWYLYDNHNWSEPLATFVDGMLIWYDEGWQVEGGGEDPQALKRLGKRINQYSQDYVEALLAGDVPAPDGGDCWACYMRTEGGENPFGPDHFLSHMEEQYYVPSLLYNAMKAMPNQVSDAMKSGVAGLWGWDGDARWLETEFIPDQLRNVIRRYMRRQLGLAS